MSAPSPAPRSASTGPNGPLVTPTSAPLVNGVGNAPGPAPSAPTASATGGAGGGMSQQNLNQICPFIFNVAVSLMLLLKRITLCRRPVWAVEMLGNFGQRQQREG
ncbi:hypothetical protein FOPE_06042 [Fonsecaea pedrosoi]|nr:hypothetical protein FOPE_06042 [Fonsecaea pedrosoi]